MKQKKKYVFLMAGWVLLCIFFCSVKARAAVFQIKKGYSDQALSEYETCLDVTAEDIATGKIYFASNREPVFLGDRWQLCWMHCCSIQNLVEACGIEDIESIESVNLGNKMTFTGEEIFDGSGRFDYIDGSSAMYYDADGSLKVQDFAYGASVWTPEGLALFYEADDVSIGSSMDAYFDSSIIGQKWADFYRRASAASYVDSCLDQGLTLFYGQLDPFDVNRPIEGIHVMYVTLKGSKPVTGEDSAGKDSGSGSDGSSGKNSRNNSTDKSTIKNKTTVKKKTTIRKTTTAAKKTQKKKSTSTKKTTNKKKTTSNKSSNKSEKRGTSNPSQYTQASTPPVTNPATGPGTGPTASGQSAKADQKEDKGKDETNDEKDEAEESEEKEEDQETGVVAESGGNDMAGTGETGTPRTFTLKDTTEINGGLTAVSEMDPDLKVIPLLILCMLAGAGFCILRFRSQIGGTALTLPRFGRKGGRS